MTNATISTLGSLRSRLAKGVAANALGKVYVAAMQLVSVPALVSAWGATDYGVWLMLSTVPTYLALSDFGFSQAATADMTMSIARGQRESALATFQSLWRLILGVGAMIVLLATIMLTSAEYFQFTPIWVTNHAATLWVLTCYAVAAQATRVILTGFHSSGNYALGTAIFDALTFAEGLLVIGAAVLGGQHLECALVLLVCRFATGAILYGVLQRRVGWMRLGLMHSNAVELKRLLKPAIGAMAIPFSLALNIQGMVLVVGSVLSPAAVAGFSAVRTISRVAVQFVGVFGRASMPEISAASALGQADGIKKILKMNLVVLSVTLIPAAVLLSFFGTDIVNFWTDAAIVPTNSFVALMAAGMVVQALWMLATQILLAMNMHGRAAALALLISTITILGAVPATKFLGINGAALALLAGDSVMVLCAYLMNFRLYRNS